MFPQQPCGCPVETSSFPYRCVAHAAPRVRLPGHPVDRHGDWYKRNTCPFCGRVNPGGLACAYVSSCDFCGTVSCDSHQMATYKLRVICPADVNWRTKTGRALRQSLTEFWNGPAEEGRTGHPRAAERSR